MLAVNTPLQFRIPLTTSHRFALLRGMAILWGLAFASIARAEEIWLESYRVSAEPILQELHPDFCWFHPRVAPMPGYGKEGQPAVMMTLQKHLVADDHYSGMYTMRTDDLGKTWTGPTEIPELAWQKSERETISVCDATPLWHKTSGKLIVIGVKLRYSNQGEQLLDEPRSQECAYAVYDPQTDVWSKWKIMSLPDAETHFYTVTPGCVQFLEQADGSLLVPLYFNKPGCKEYITTVAHASFDGNELKYLEHGDEISPGGWGFVEPSLIQFQGKYYLTLRHLEAAYGTEGPDAPLQWENLGLGGFHLPLEIKRNGIEGTDAPKWRYETLDQDSRRLPLP